MSFKRILTTSLFLFAIAGLFISSGCKERKAAKALEKRKRNGSHLVGTWKLLGYINPGQTEMRPLPEDQGRGIQMTFIDDGKIGKFTGHTKVNEIMGSYTLQDHKKIDIGNFTGTKVGGEPKWGTKFWRGLKSIHSYETHHQHHLKQLHLIYDEANAQMVFEEVPQDEAAGEDETQQDDKNKEKK